MIEDGETVATISKTLGISVSSVNKALKVSSLDEKIQKNSDIPFTNKVTLAKASPKVRKEISEKDLLNLSQDEFKKKVSSIHKSFLKLKRNKGERVVYKLNQKKLVEYFKKIENPEKFNFNKSEILKECFNSKIVTETENN
jgi:uncharacterized membrane protein YhiD involved in acid resistance